MNQRRQAELFLAALRNSPVDLEGLQIVVFEINAYNRYGKLFIPILREVIDNGDWPEHIRGMRTVDLAAELGPDSFFQIDDHINAKGHRYIAERLWQLIRKLEGKEQDERL